MMVPGPPVAVAPLKREPLNPHLLPQGRPCATDRATDYGGDTDTENSACMALSPGAPPPKLLILHFPVSVNSAVWWSWQPPTSPQSEPGRLPLILLSLSLSQLITMFS